MTNSKNIKRTSWYKGLDEIDKNFLAKLTVDPRATSDRDSTLLNTGSMVSGIFNRQLQTISDIDNIFRVLPQLAFPRKILISSILSPGDITKTGVVVDNALKLSDYELSSQMTSIIRELLEDELEIPTKLSSWMDEALILKGSHPILTLPSSVVDTIMGASMESSTGTLNVTDVDYYRPKGLLGVKSSKGDFVSFESRGFDRQKFTPMNLTGNINYGKKGKDITLPFVLTDNPSILVKGMINEFNLSRKTSNLYGDTSFESMARYPDPDGKKPKFLPADIRREFFKSANTEYDRILVLPTPKDVEEDVNIGHPLEFHLSADSIIPVTSPGDPTDHKYYIILVDENGYPLSGGDRLKQIDEIRRTVMNSGNGNDVTSTLLASAASNLGMKNSNYDLNTIDEMAKINSALIESEVTRSIMAGANAGEGKLAISDSVSKLMLSRSLKGKRTVLLYVPADYITYIAFDYNELGIGKSILEDSKSMAGMLSTLTVANVIGSVEQAIPGKNLNIQLDPNDKDPIGSATFLAREAMDLNFRRFPMGLNNTLGVAEELQMNSYSVTVTGHPAFPEVATNMTAKESSRQPIDTELMDKLNEYMHLLFSVPPEVIGSANQAEFATTVVATNLMLLKTVIEKQTVANKHISRYARNYARYSGVVIARFYNLIKENKKSIPQEYKSNVNEFISDFIENIRVKLPSPETENITHQMQLVNAFRTAVEEALDAHLNEESLLLEGYTPEIVQSVLPALRAAYKHHAMRNYMRERGIMNELDIFRIGDEDNPTIILSDELKDHSKHVIRSVRNFIKNMASVLKPEMTELKAAIKEDAKAKENAEDVNNAGQPADEEGGEEGYSDTDSDDVGDDDYGDDESSDDDMDSGEGDDNFDSDDSDSGDEDDSEDIDEDAGDDEEDIGEDTDEDSGDDSVEEPVDEDESSEEEDSDDEDEEDELPIDKVDEDKL